ncbi:MAG: TIGR00341 family protein [Anaerolineae bacterium]
MSEIRVGRGLSRWQAVARGVGVMFTTAALVALGDVLEAAGPLASLPHLLALLLLLANLLGYAELAVRSPRPGGAYVNTRQAEREPVAFFTGWSLILASLGLCALLAHGFGVQVVALLRNHLNLACPAWPWAAGLVLLLGVYNASGTQRGRRGSATVLVLSVALLVGIALLALPQIELDRFTAGPRNWQSALALVLVPFLGLEVTASLRTRLPRRVSDKPWVFLLAPVVTTVLVAVVASVAWGVLGPEAWPTQTDPQVPLALVGAGVGGGAGRPLVLALGALGLTLALDSVLVLVVRQIYVMGKDGYWPGTLLKMHPRFGTPVWIIILVALLVLPLASIPIPFLTRLAGLLYLATLMGVNLTLALTPQSETSSFRLPFHPWVPALALVIDALVAPLWGPTCVAWAAGCLGLGGILYFAYARSHHLEAQEGITVFKPSKKEGSKVDHRVLVPIANPATAGTLLRLAGVLASQQGGDVLALQVVTVPDQVPLEEGRHRAAVSRVLLERAMTQAKEEGFSIQTTTRVAHTVAEGILDAAREETVDMIVLGWSGTSRTPGASMGPVIDAVLRDAPCEVVVAKGEAWRGAERILLPTAGGPNSPVAARLALALSAAYGSQVTAVYVQPGRASPQQMEENKRRIAQTLNGLAFERQPEQRVIIANSVVEGVVREAEGYDVVVLGASEEGMFDQLVFGSVPQQIAAGVPRAALIVRRYEGATEFWIRRLTRGLLSVLPRLNVREQLELHEAMSASARPGANFFVLIVLSSIIAALGLLLDSAAVVIGAMLVAPLMSPILGFSLGMVLGDVRLIRVSIEAMFKGVVLALIIAVLIGAISPFKTLTDEIMARTQPTLLDLAVALASGMAGAYSLSREEVSAALPGVAISAALMPPLSVAGLGLSLGQPRVAAAAFLLFLANIAAISLAGVIVFLLLGVRSRTWQPGENRRIRRGLIAFGLMVLVIAIPLGIIMAGIVRQSATQRAIQQVLTQQLAAHEGELVSFEHQVEQGDLWVSATVQTVDGITAASVDAIASALRNRMDRPVTLEVVTLPVVRSSEP